MKKTVLSFLLLAGIINQSFAQQFKVSYADSILTNLLPAVFCSIYNFLLNYAVVMLEGEMKKLNSTFVFQYYPGDHFTVSTPEFRKDGYNFLEKKYTE
jgi:hypothetical protein